MDTIRFLTLDEVFSIHRRQLASYGGSDGLRDRGLLLSALAQPEMAFAGRWLHEDIFAMAAAYAYHVVQNHPFVDGNKRVGAAAAVIFLKINRIACLADPDAYADLILAVAEGKAAKDDIAVFLRAHAAR